VRTWLEERAMENGMSLVRFIGRLANFGAPEALDWMKAYLNRNVSNRDLVWKALQVCPQAGDDSSFLTYVMRSAPMDTRIILHLGRRVGVSRILACAFPITDPIKVSFLCQTFGSQALIEAARTSGLEKPFS
jgi:hypothetical protein